MFVRDTGNRVLWALIGAVLACAGGFGYAAATGNVPAVDPRRLLVPHSWLRHWRSGGHWSLVIVGCVGVALVVLGLWLLVRGGLRRKRRRALRDVTFTPRRSDVGGVITVTGTTLARATSDALRRDPLVRDAVTTLRHIDGGTTLLARMDAQPDCEISDARQAMSRVYDAFTTMVGQPPSSLDVTVRPTRARPAEEPRVR